MTGSGTRTVKKSRTSSAWTKSPRLQNAAFSIAPVGLKLVSDDFFNGLLDELASC